MTLIQVIIPNWNGHHLLKGCLIALSHQTFKDFSVTVVDNGSTDNSVPWLQMVYPDIQVIVNNKNLGFAVAINQGIKIGNSKYVVTLNNDTYPEPAWLENLLFAIEGLPEVGMCASKMLFADRQYMINSTGINLDWIGIAWDRCGGEYNDTEENFVQEVFGACAGAALYRRKLLEDLGGFDEVFFAYLEDVDLAWRARLAGWRSLYVSNAIVYHHHSATAGEGSQFKNYLLGRNKLWLIVKNYPMPYLIRYLPLIVLYDLGILFYTMFVRKDWSTGRGRWVALRGIRTILRKRRVVQSNIRDVENWTRFVQPIIFPWRIPRRYQHLQKNSGLVADSNR